MRALYGSYNGNLYQVTRASDNTTKDIGVLSTGGFANAATQDSFCSGTSCVIARSSMTSPGRATTSPIRDRRRRSPETPGDRDDRVADTRRPQGLLALHQSGQQLLEKRLSSGIPTGSAPEGMYMVTSGTHVNSGCCFDYGNSETDRKADGSGAMDAINFGTSCWFSGRAPDPVPGSRRTSNTGSIPEEAQPGTRTSLITSKFVTAMLKNNGTTEFAIKGGNAQSGSLTTAVGRLASHGYNPMKKQGAIVLGSGGDCCATTPT